MGRIIQLELTNFKSYKGTQIIGPFDSFTAIIGPNGSGKSNIMDAISFVLGVKTSQLRSTHLKELIYRGVEGSNRIEDFPKKAEVVLEYMNDSEITFLFKRTITQNGNSEYRINSITKTFNEYNKVLEKENILVKAKNFLVFQGNVEQIASQSSKDVTALIEQISGSEEFKADYECLKSELDKAIENSNSEFNVKRSMASEVKLAEDQKQEADKYRYLTYKRSKLILEQIIWKIYHLDTQFRKEKVNISTEEDNIKKIQKDIDAKEKIFNKNQKENSSKKLKLIELDNKMKKLDEKVQSQETENIKQDQKYNHIDQKFQNMEVLKTQIQRDYEFQDKQLTKQKDEIEKLKSLLKKHEKQLDDVIKEQSSKKKVQITDQDRKTYKDLKQRYEVEAIKLHHELENLSRKKRHQTMNLNNFEEKEREIENKLTQLKDSLIKIENQKMTVYFLFLNFLGF